MAKIKLELTPNNASLLEATVWQAKEKLGNNGEYPGLRQEFEGILQQLNSEENREALSNDVHTIYKIQLQRNVYVWECRKCYRRFRNEEEIYAVVCGYPSQRQQDINWSNWQNHQGTSENME